MNHSTPNTKTKATLIDTTMCIGCRSCQVSCKQWNDLEALETQLPEHGLGLQSPKVLSAKTYTVVTFHEIADSKAPGGMHYIASQRRCMHCLDPACVSACPVTALAKDEFGNVTYDAAKCLGCRYCMWACPFGVPTADWDSLAPKIHKCTGCSDRPGQPAPAERNGQKLSADDAKGFLDKHGKPACVGQCPTGALKYGDRDELLAEAHKRISANPKRYVNHIYGEKEAGGTGVLYLASVPFDQLGFPTVDMESYAAKSVPALSIVPPAVLGMGALLGGIHAIAKRSNNVAKAEGGKGKAADDHHVDFLPVEKTTWTKPNVLYALLAALAGIAMIARFALGLGGSTNLSDTYAWGLWIVFDLIWIAIAAGAFTAAGLIYVFQRKDLYSIGRTAVLMGLLSYSFVTVTLVADLGLPWHFWQLAVQAPKHSAMFEVSWCVGLYVTILAFEFIPVPLERFGLKNLAVLWEKWAPVYVVLALTLFVYLMSRNFMYTAAAFVIFGALAVIFRTRPGEKHVPIMLAIAAVTLSTMHQSSLGSLFLLMPDKLSAMWWSPIMPLYFFLSSIAAGIALVILIEMAVAKAFKRSYNRVQLAALGKVALIALLVYEIVRVADVAMRGQFASAFAGGKGNLFLIEILLGGLVPIIMLASSKVRNAPFMLGVASSLSLFGVVFNRMNVVIFGMDLKGPIPQIAPSSYWPSLVEWAIPIGLMAATVLLIALGIRFLPVLSKEHGARSRS
ncbi:MAG: NrfD/PsrC family molybdoenzyme membrane anchor subunit [Syntrophobacteraceae bacterium]